MENSIWITAEERAQIEGTIQLKEQKFFNYVDEVFKDEETRKDWKNLCFGSRKKNFEDMVTYHVCASKRSEIDELKCAYSILLKIPRLCMNIGPYDYLLPDNYSLVMGIYDLYRNFVNSFCNFKSRDDFTDLVVDIFNFDDDLRLINYQLPVWKNKNSLDKEMISLKDYECAISYSSNKAILLDALKNQWTYNEYFKKVNDFYYVKYLNQTALDIMIWNTMTQNRNMYENPTDVLVHNFSNVLLYDDKTLDVVCDILYSRSQAKKYNVLKQNGGSMNPFVFSLLTVDDKNSEIIQRIRQYQKKM